MPTLAATVTRLPAGPVTAIVSSDVPSAAVPLGVSVKLTPPGPVAGAVMRTTRRPFSTQ